jgi:hypothetical protein
MFNIAVSKDRTTTICFLCARKLFQTGILKREQLPQDDPNIKRIVEV